MFNIVFFFLLLSVVIYSTLTIITYFLFIFSVCECVFSSEFIYSLWIPWEKVHGAKQSFVYWGKENCFGVALSLVLFLLIFFFAYMEVMV